MSEIRERIARLRALMAERGIDAYLVPTSDYHESEYVGEHFACRSYITGFSGSAGTALIMKDWAGIWTDGRYFVQAAKELSGSGVELMRMGQPDVPSLEEYLAEHLPAGGVLGFDGRVVNGGLTEKLLVRLEDKNISFSYKEDLIGGIWKERPPLSAEPMWVLDERYAGKSSLEKIRGLRAQMKMHHADMHVLTTLDDIAWLLNVRGGDIPGNPVVLSYLVLTQDEIRLFVNLVVVSQEVRRYLTGLGVDLYPYQDIYTYTQQICGARVLLETEKVNYALNQYVKEHNCIIDRMNPTTLAKACKNMTEIENLKAAHIKDGVAITKYLYWLKTNIGKIPMTECSAASYLDRLRLEQGALEPSFTTISAYGKNAALCHYHAQPESCAELEPRGLYLVDSGGQYLEGTTDVTRTVALGPVTEKEREHYTLVLISMLRLAHVKFLKGCTGLSLDYVAREPLWRKGLDYNHGTGHGVGYLLNVHERPVSIRFRTAQERQDSTPFLPGMVCSDEPGIYIEGSHGIRTENMVFCKEDEKTDFGQFLSFEYLTYVPIDLEPVDVSLMEPRDVSYLNEYHAQVYEKISPYLTEAERMWLREATQPLGD